MTLAAGRRSPSGTRDAWRRATAVLDDPQGPTARTSSAGGAAWQRVVGAVSKHTVLTDAGLTVVLAALATPYLLRFSHPGPGRWVLHLALLVPIVWRRRYPVGVFVTLCLVAFVQWLFADRLVTDITLLVALYTVAVARPRRVALAAAALVELGVVLAIARWSLTESWLRSLVFLSAMVAAALLLGVNVRGRRLHLATLTERAERLEREQEQQSRIAAATERTRIAREMHDVLAHSLAVMVSLADGAAAKLGTDPERAATAIAHVSDLGRQSLRDTRRLLGVLRSDDGPGTTTPQPGVADLDDLLAGVRATGLDVTLRVTGTPFDVPPGAGLTVYRIVQEALTNSVKHAAGAHSVQVTLAYDDPDLDIGIDDDGVLPWPSAGTPLRPPLRSGHGLAGMRERATLHHGSVEAGPGPEGGWRVQARLPVGPGATR